MTRGGDPLETAVLRVARGAGIILVGGVIARLLGVGGRVLVARHFSVHDFGLLSMGVAMAGVVQPFATLGLASGLPRYVGYHLERGDAAALRGVVLGGLWVAGIFGLATGAGIALAAGPLAQAMDAPGLAPVLRVFAMAIPVNALCTVLLAAFRGLGRTRENVLFDSVLANVLKFAFLLAVALAGAGLAWAAGAYVLASALELLVLAGYGAGILRPVLGTEPARWAVGREMLRFSAPLVASDALGAFTKQSGPLVLGFFLTPAQVGVFSAASLFTAVIGVFHKSLRFLYLPVTSGLVGGERTDLLRGLYTAAAKASTVLTFPVVAVLVVLPGSVLSLVFGPEYQSGAQALQLLTVGQFVGVWLGPNGMSLLAAGHSRPLFWASILGGAANLGLSVALIPLWGVGGAALAAASSQLAVNAYLSFRLYQLTGLHPFTGGFTRLSLFMGAVLLAGGIGIARFPMRAGLPVMAGAGLLFVGLTLAAVWLLRAADELDRSMVRRFRGRLHALLPR